MFFHAEHKAYHQSNEEKYFFLNVVQFELPEIRAHYNKSHANEQLTVLFFNRIDLPPDISKHISSYAFSPDENKMIAEKINAIHQEKNDKKCICM